MTASTERSGSLLSLCHTIHCLEISIEVLMNDELKLLLCLYEGSRVMVQIPVTGGNMEGQKLIRTTHLLFVTGK